MKKRSKKPSFRTKLVSTITSWLTNHLPLLAVIAVALLVAVRNVDPQTTFSGWDNVHPEFDLPRYARQVLFGAWTEHQGLGAPAAQGQLAEVFRLPILFLLDTLLPQNLSRYAFIFLMYAIGGAGMYLYLANVWLKEKTRGLKNWLAGLGGVFYLLHILTLQQFYISFEMFMVQFAFLPFLLWSVERLAHRKHFKYWAAFAGIQLLIAPSGHTPTVFYLGALVSVAYAFFLQSKQSLARAVKFALTVGLATLALNAYWIVPNLYYTLHNAEYVQESRENHLFGPESVAAVREAGTVGNFLTGTQYLLTWKDYSFETKNFEYIFNDWQEHLSQPAVRYTLQAFGVITVFGLVITLLDARKDPSRWAMVLTYAACVALIWIELFPTKILIDALYKSGSFLEAFRNPFTKLSIIYSVISVLFFVRAGEFFVSRIKWSVLRAVVVGLLVGTIVWTAWPTFQGHFLSEKLTIKYPDQYQQLFDYLKTRDRDLRVLQLPQLMYVGWEYYDWSFVEPGNGYQGMGFYGFAMPQAFLNRDSDRWSEANDFFAHELKLALAQNDGQRLRTIAEKYNVDLIIVDETRVAPGVQRDFLSDHALAQLAGFVKVWEQDFLTVYERKSENAERAFFAPDTISWVAGETDRVRLDPVFDQQRDFVLTDQKAAQTIYPFSGLSARSVVGVTFEDRRITLTQPVARGMYTAILPALTGPVYVTPVSITYDGQRVTMTFPKVTVEADQLLELAKLPDVQFPVENAPDNLIVFANETGVVVSKGETVAPVVSLAVGEPVRVEYTANADTTRLAEAEIIPVITLEPDWNELTREVHFEVSQTDTVTAVVDFPVSRLDLLQSPSENCAQPQQGTIRTERTAQGVVFVADNFGVNCNGYNFEYLSPAYSYVMRVVGENVAGRGTKLFVNYGNPDYLPEDFLFRTKHVDEVVTLPQLSTDPTEVLQLNWETRSFGKRSENVIQSIDVAPVPMERLVGMRLVRGEERVENVVRVSGERVWFDTVYVAEVSCESDSCVVGLDQAFDDGWLASQKGKILPHVRLNTWANGWEVTSGKLVVVYLPEAVAIVLLIGLGSGLVSALCKVRRV